MQKFASIYRITDWLHYLGFVLMGFGLKITHIDIISLKSLISVLFFCALLLSYAYSLNDYFDEVKKKKYFLLPLISLTALLPFFNFSQILLGTIFLILVTLYSFRGISLMKFPITSTLSNSIGFILIFGIGYAAKEGIAILSLIFAFLLIIYQTISQLIHEKVHLEEDTAAGRKTSVFYLKERLAFCLRIMLLLTLPLAVFLLFRTDFFLFAFACILFSSFFFIKVSQIDKDLRKRYKLAGIIVGLFFLIDYFLEISFIL